MSWFKRLPRIVRDLLVFNAFIFAAKFIINYGLKKEFIISSTSLIAANVGVTIVYLYKYKIEKTKAEERVEKNKNKKK